MIATKLKKKKVKLPFLWQIKEWKFIVCITLLCLEVWENRISFQCNREGFFPFTFGECKGLGPQKLLLPSHFHEHNDLCRALDTVGSHWLLLRILFLRSWRRAKNKVVLNRSASSYLSSEESRARKDLIWSSSPAICSSQEPWLNHHNQVSVQSALKNYQGWRFQFL